MVYTIEGNTSDACRRRARYASTIVGYGRPDYSGSPHDSAQEAISRRRASPRIPEREATSSDAAPLGQPLLRRGSAGVLVKQLQRCLNKVQRSRLEVDGDFGPMTSAAVKSFQRRARGLTVDGEYGAKTAGKLTVARRNLR